MSDTKTVTMLCTQRGANEDPNRPETFKKGGTYTMRGGLADVFIREKWATKAKEPKPEKKDKGGAPENKDEGNPNENKGASTKAEDESDKKKTLVDKAKELIT